MTRYIFLSLLLIGKGRLEERWSDTACLERMCSTTISYALIVRRKSEAVLSFSDPQTSLFSSLETLLQALEDQKLPLEHQRRLTRKALHALAILARRTPSSPERLRIAEYLYRFAAASEQWTFLTEDVAEHFAWAASVFFVQEMPEAELLLRRALAIWERLYGLTDERVLSAQHNLATLLEKQDNYNEAELLMHRVIQGRMQAANRRELAAALHNLAYISTRQEKREEAEALYRKALVIAEQEWGEQHPLTLTIRSHLALLYAQWLPLSKDWRTDAEDRLAEAEMLVRRVSLHWQHTAGSEDLAATKLLHQLALLLVGQEKWAEAEAAYQRVLDNYTRLLGPDDLILASCLDQLMLCSQQQGKIAEALEIARSALLLRERLLGALHPDLAPTLCSMATLCIWQEHFSQAETLLSRAHTICLQTFGTEHPAIALVLNTRLLLYAKENRLAEALPLLNQMAELFAGLFGPEAAETQAIRAQYSRALAEAEKSEQVERQHRCFPSLNHQG